MSACRTHAMLVSLQADPNLKKKPAPTKAPKANPTPGKAPIYVGFGKE